MITVKKAGAVERTLEVSISTGSDDVEQRADGSMYTNSSDLEMILDSSSQVVGLRFQNISIPKGAFIKSAYIQFSANETDDIETSLTITGENVDNAPAFSSARENVSSRNKTSASVNWDSIPAWEIIREADVKQRTPDLAGIISEILSRPGWNQGGSMVFIIQGTGKRVADSYEKSSSYAPKLKIVYTLE